MVNVWLNGSAGINLIMIREKTLTIDRAKVLVAPRPLCILANGLDSIWPNGMDSNRPEILGQIFAGHHHQLDLGNMSDQLQRKLRKKLITKMNLILCSLMLNSLPASSHKCKSMR